MGENTFEYDDDDDFDGGYDTGNDALKQARAAARANAKMVKDLKAQLEEQSKALSQFQQEKHQATVGDLLKAKGANPQLARWLAKDEVEASDEAVTKWLAENGELFGYKPGEATGQTGTENAAASSTDDAGDPEMAQIIEAMNRVQSSESNAARDLPATQKINDAISDLGKNVNSFEEAESALRKLGII